MCVFSGLAHLHSLNIVHRDVKAAPWPIHCIPPSWDAGRDVSPHTSHENEGTFPEKGPF